MKAHTVELRGVSEGQQPLYIFRDKRGKVVKRTRDPSILLRYQQRHLPKANG